MTTDNEQDKHAALNCTQKIIFEKMKLFFEQVLCAALRFSDDSPRLRVIGASQVFHAPTFLGYEIL